MKSVKRQIEILAPFQQQNRLPRTKPKSQPFRVFFFWRHCRNWNTLKYQRCLLFLFRYDYSSFSSRRRLVNVHVNGRAAPHRFIRGSFSSSQHASRTAAKGFFPTTPLPPFVTCFCAIHEIASVCYKIETNLHTAKFVFHDVGSLNSICLFFLSSPIYESRLQQTFTHSRNRKSKSKQENKNK